MNFLLTTSCMSSMENEPECGENINFLTSSYSSPILAILSSSSVSRLSDCEKVNSNVNVTTTTKISLTK